MTREAKIGMLTGLGVIVLIGVLLSEYLGDPKGLLAGAKGIAVGASGAGGQATGSAAELPIGAQYRQQIVEPIAVPTMDRSLATVNGTSIQAPLAMNNAPLPPGFASEPIATNDSGPRVSAAVAPVTVEPLPMETEMATGPSTFRLPDTGRVADAGSPAVVRNTPAAAVPANSTIYVIAAGDNLAKIAKKFYNANKLSDVQKIVAANPTILKDASTMLVAGKKLTIPNVPAASTPGMPGPVSPRPVAPTAVRISPKPAAAAPIAKADPVMIYLPGPLANDVKAGSKTDVASAKPPVGPVVPPTAAAAKKDAPKMYVVAAGDTLEKIAKKLSPSNPTEMIEKIKAANAIKDVHGLQIGQKLKMPV